MTATVSKPIATPSAVAPVEVSRGDSFYEQAAALLHRDAWRARRSRPVHHRPLPPRLPCGRRGPSRLRRRDPNHPYRHSDRLRARPAHRRPACRRLRPPQAAPHRHERARTRVHRDRLRADGGTRHGWPSVPGHWRGRLRRGRNGYRARPFLRTTSHSHALATRARVGPRARARAGHRLAAAQLR